MRERDKPIIAVTGAGGQLGQELIRLTTAQVDIVGLDRSELDITDGERCLAALSSIRPDIVIHAAAYTAVDQAESEPDEAWRVNVDGTRHVAVAAEAVGAKFCYISTDYVFDGAGTSPYREDHPTAPQTIYGKTKLAGEQAAAKAASQCFIVRTSWVYGRYGNNFVRTMLELGRSRPQISVVHDQVGAPTCTYDLASFLLDLTASRKFGIYHASNSGACTWYEFAQAIFREAGITDVVVLPCTTEQFPRPAPRPAYSVLGGDALLAAGFAPLRHWRKALRDFLSRSDGKA
ncbi:dTDP-4-dehydrorhamnose reductase [Cohnella boryungensis]|uniref:dTDP-4-dehydrorhamnose reductase n=1 Tax=Cohnella boryungensis TaxID=768479 RepID=A0ABV8S7W4_9BACL